MSKGGPIAGLPQHRKMIAERTFPGKDDCERIASGTTERGADVIRLSE